MSVRITPAFCTLVLPILVMTGSLSSPVDGQAPGSARHGLLASRSLPGPLPPNRVVYEYQLSSVHDRIAHRTRVSLQLFQRSGHVADGSFMSFWISATYSGQVLRTVPDSVELEFIGYSPLRRGWAFGHPRSLIVVLDDSVQLEFTSPNYLRTPTHFGDSRRIDALHFRVSTPDLVRLASSVHVVVKVGRYTIKLDQRGLEPIRAFIRQLESLQEFGET